MIQSCIPPQNQVNYRYRLSRQVLYTGAKRINVFVAQCFDDPYQVAIRLCAGKAYILGKMVRCNRANKGKCTKVVWPHATYSLLDRSEPFFSYSFCNTRNRLKLSNMPEVRVRATNALVSLFGDI